MNKRTMKKMAKAKQQAAEAAKTAETVVKAAAPAKEVEPTTEKTLHTEAAEGKAEAAKEPKNGLTGEIKIYLNAEQRAAYYTVDGQGSDDFKVDLTTLAE